MKEMKAGLRLDLTGNISSGLKSAGRAMQEFFQKGTYAGNLLQGSIKKAGSGLDALGNKYTALLTGAGTTLAIKNVGELNARLTRIGINSGRSAAEMDALRDSIYRVAQQRDINIAPGELLNASSKVMEETGGNLELVQNNLEKMAMAISATGASGEAVGKMAAGLFRNLNVRDAQEMVDIMGMLSNMGKQGGVSLKDFAEQSDRIMVAYAKTGRKGIDAAADMAAMLQMARKTAADSGEASMFVEQMLKRVASQDFRKELEETNISIMDPNDPTRMKSMVELTKELIRVSGGDRTKLDKLFQNGSLNAILPAIDEFKTTGGFGSFDKILAVSRDSSGIVADSARAAAEFNAALTSFRSAVGQFANNNLAEPLNRLAQALNRITPEQMQRYLDLAGKVVVGLGALVVARKGFNMAKGIYGFLKNPLGAAAGGALGGSGAPVPVYVVNAPALGGAGGVAKGASLAGMGKLAAKGAGMAYLAFAAGSEISNIKENGFFGAADKNRKEQASNSAMGNALDAINPMKLGYAIEALTTKALTAMFGERDTAASRSENYIKIEVDTTTGKSRVKEMRNNDSPDANTDLDFSLGGASYAM